jgi:hypothetical protein
MNNDSKFIFEAFLSRNQPISEKSKLHFGMSEGEYIKQEEKREKEEHKQFKKDYNKAVKSGDLKPGHKSEDDESQPAGWLSDYVSDFKRLFGEVYGIGYQGDGISDEQFAAAANQIIGSDWGDEAPKAKEALIYLLKGFYGSGIQDS